MSHKLRVTWQAPSRSRVPRQQHAPLQFLLHSRAPAALEGCPCSSLLSCLSSSQERPPPPGSFLSPTEHTSSGAAVFATCPEGQRACLQCGPLELGTRLQHHQPSTHVSSLCSIVLTAGGGPGPLLPAELTLGLAHTWLAAYKNNLQCRPETSEVSYGKCCLHATKRPWGLGQQTIPFVVHTDAGPLGHGGRPSPTPQMSLLCRMLGELAAW